VPSLLKGAGNGLFQGKSGEGDEILDWFSFFFQKVGELDTAFEAG
jgi:hypothetical protein